MKLQFTIKSLGLAGLGLTLFSASASAATVVWSENFDTFADNSTSFGWTDLSTATSFWIGVAGEAGNPSATDAATAGFGGTFLTTARQSAAVGSQPTDGSLEKVIDLSAYSADIDNGDQTLLVNFDWASNDNRDTGTFTLDFFASTDGTGASLGTFSVALDDANGFLFVNASESVGGAVPVGTQSMTLQIATTRTGGSETNLWFDNFEATLVPEPSIALLGGLGLLALVRRRRAA